MFLATLRWVPRGDEAGLVPLVSGAYVVGCNNVQSSMGPVCIPLNRINQLTLILTQFNMTWTILEVLDESQVALILPVCHPPPIPLSPHLVDIQAEAPCYTMSQLCDLWGVPF